MRRQEEFLAGGGWRVVGDGWWVTGGGWWVVGDGSEIGGRKSGRNVRSEALGSLLSPLRSVLFPHLSPDTSEFHLRSVQETIACRLRIN
jgi:hypothetical protein